jgi:signal transduction histidine kinase
VAGPARRIPILAKLLGAYLVPTVAVFAGFGVLAHYTARRALEDELGRRLTAVAGAAASQLGDENIGLLTPGDETTRTYRNIKKRLDELAAAAGVARLYLFDREGRARCDTRGEVPIGERFYTLDANRSELRAVFGAGTPAASVLFRGRDGGLYKSGFAPVRDDAGQVAFAVGADGAASLYEQLAGFRRTLVAVGVGLALAVVALSVVVARLFTRPIRTLERAAARIGAGDLEAPVGATSRDEIGLVAETLEAMRATLRSRDERMQMMLAGIAHEVRNPLAGMELYAGLLREELATDSQNLDFVKRIERELGHLKIIVGDFLEYARRPRPELQARDVAELLTEVRDLTLAVASEQRVALTLEAEPARAPCDSGQLRRALLNLARNAVQACPSDGSGQVRLGCARHNGEVVVTVRDTGQGIAPEALAKIWNPFYTTKQSGTGLGLAFVREIARDHGARLDVASEPGQGTTFTLALKAES